MLAAAAAIVHPRQGMAKTYRRHLGTRLINWWFRTLTTLGLGAPYRQMLTVPGRKTGRLHSTPVDVIEVGGQRWLVAGYGPANWVLNTRAPTIEWMRRSVRGGAEAPPRANRLCGEVERGL